MIYLLKTLLSLLVCVGAEDNVQDNAGLVNDFTAIYCPTVTHCITGTTIFSDSIPQTGYVTGLEVENCGGTPFLPFHLKFEALSEEMEVVLEWDDPSYMKMGIIDGCYSGGQCVVGATCENKGVISIFTENLYPGHTYVLSVDNCNSQGEFNFQVTMTPGPTGNFQTISEISLEKPEACENGLSDNKFCSGIDLVLGLEGPSEAILEYLMEKEATWHFGLNGPENDILTIEDMDEFVLNFSNPGNYNLELVSIDLECESYDIGLSYDFEIVNVDEDFGEFKVCMHELVDWTPGENWLGPVISEPGTYEYFFEDECACPYAQTVSVIELEESIEEVVLELCPADYPYDYFEYHELQYHPSNYDLMLNFANGSLQENWEGNRCDSLVHLFVINEYPENRCGSCELPITLEESEIVYCVNFDNETFDVSGNANPIEAVGIGYDNNGPAYNRNWEAIFDGKDEYVRAPHSVHLNTSGFALDLRFNKDEDFGNGPYESLVSKGDPALDNLRFQVGLQQTAENRFVIAAEFYSNTQELIFYSDTLQMNSWHGVTLVSIEDSIVLYLDGLEHRKAYFPEDLKGNQLDLYLGARKINGVLTSYYEGRLDDFKYWKQGLTGQDILYVYQPGKEFEVNLEFFQSCCDTTTYMGLEIGSHNPIDTIVVPGASPNGYDSLYILRHINYGNGPELIEPNFFKDIYLDKEVSCNEFCEATVTWDEPYPELFEDHCEGISISSSHSSPLVIDENISFVEVVYEVENICGNISEYRFDIELNCIALDYTPLPVNNDFELVDSSCEQMSDSIFCKNQEIILRPIYFDSLLSIPLSDYSDIDGFSYTTRIEHDSEFLYIESMESDGVELDLSEEGLYNICLDKIESDCESVSPGVCRTIEIIERREIDYGVLVACNESVEELLPDEISNELKNLILDSSDDGEYIINSEDNCGCALQEKLTIDYINDNPISELIFSLCESELPIEILDQEFGIDQNYQQELVVFDNASMQTDMNGNHCDSLILLTIEVLEEKESLINKQICEGSAYMGYNESGTYIDVFEGSNGCDSMRTLQLEVLPVLESFIESTICQGENYMGFSEAGTYSMTDVSVNGCDSITHIDLTVMDTTWVETYKSICEGETYMGFSEEGIYYQVYSDEFGCDSTIVLELEILDEDDPLCETSSIIENENESIWGLYPNPVDHTLYLVSKLAASEFIIITIYDVYGNKKIERRGVIREINVSELPIGIYYMKISQRFQPDVSKKFIKIE